MCSKNYYYFQNPVPRTCCKLEGGQEADFEISVPVNWNTCKTEANGNYLEDKTQLNKEVTETNYT